MEDKATLMQKKAVEALRTVYDPEIPVNIYDLGLIYRIETNDEATSLSLDMTLTAPNCPAADFIVEDTKQKLQAMTGLSDVEVNLVFEPQWERSMMSDEAKLELGLL